jgi:hypothetical protein
MVQQGICMGAALPAIPKELGTYDEFDMARPAGLLTGIFFQLALHPSSDDPRRGGANFRNSPCGHDVCEWCRSVSNRWRLPSPAREHLGLETSQQSVQCSPELP